MFDRMPAGASQFLEAFRALQRSRYDDVAVTAIADRLGWTVGRAQVMALDLADLRLIETDAGMGDVPTVVEGEA